MPENEEKWSGLRQKAEAFINKSPSAVKEVPPQDVRTLVEELQIHQVELEMQNEELRRAQLELQEERDRYSDLYDFAPIGYLTISDKGMIQEANLTAATMLGVERGNLVGRPLSNFIHRSDQDTFYLYLRKLSETRTRQDCELRLIKKDGSRFYARLECIVISNTEGAVTSLRAAISNIDDRKQAEEALTLERDQLLSIFDSMDLLIDVVDPLRYEILFMNRYGQRLFRCDPTGEPCYRVFHGMDAPCAACNNQALLRDPNRILQWEYHNNLLDRQFLATNRLIIWPDGRIVKLTIDLDVTERHLAEEQRRTLEIQLQKAQRLEALGTLAGGIAHDLNNLLAVILGKIELCSLDTEPGSGIEANLSGATQACSRAQELARRFLTFSKGGDPVKAIGDLAKVIQDATDLSLSGANVKPQFSMPDDLWSAKFDEGQMKQVISNLVINATEAMPQGGTIDVRAENVSLCEGDILNLEEGKYIKISVRDEGAGIPQEDLEKIFDPYFSTKEMGAQKGMGLGLSICHSIIKRHGGHIGVASDEGIGTMFSLYFPAAIAESPDERDSSLHGADQTPDAERDVIEAQSTIDNQQSSIQ